jgi:hypothetical protein
MQIANVTLFVVALYGKGMECSVGVLLSLGNKIQLESLNV